MLLAAAPAHLASLPPVEPAPQPLAIQDQLEGGAEAAALPETNVSAPAAPNGLPSASDIPAASAPDSADPHDPTAIVVTARPPADPRDPLESANAISFSAVQAVDKAFVGPVSLAYKQTVPKPVRSGLRHFLDNLQEPVVFLNYVLQAKPGKALETLGRFTVNSTIGVAGLIDVAKNKPFKWRRHPNGFAFTLGYYGIKPGPFLFLPVIGPTTVRDLFGRWVDLLLLPVSIGKPFNRPAYGATTLVFRSLDERAESDERLNKLRSSGTGPYSALREDYLRNRQAEIDELRGRPSVPVEPASTPSGAESVQPPATMGPLAPSPDNANPPPQD